MWAKHLFVAGFAALSVVTAPLDAVRVAYTGEARVIAVQDQRRERAHDIRPVREVVAELRARYGGEYVSHTLVEGPRPFYVVRWRMPDGLVRDIRVSAVR